MILLQSPTLSVRSICIRAIQAYAFVKTRTSLFSAGYYARRVLRVYNHTVQLVFLGEPSRSTKRGKKNKKSQSVSSARIHVPTIALKQEKHIDTISFEVQPQTASPTKPDSWTWLTLNVEPSTRNRRELNRGSGNEHTCQALGAE